MLHKIGKIMFIIHLRVLIIEPIKKYVNQKISLPKKIQLLDLTILNFQMTVGDGMVFLENKGLAL